jgi:hypothetical protein
MMGLLFDFNEWSAREVNDALFDLVAVESFGIHLAETAFTRRTNVVPVFVAPASTDVSLECLTIQPVGLRATDNIPARDHRTDVLDPFNAHFLFGDSPANALKPLDVCF